MSLPSRTQNVFGLPRERANRQYVDRVFNHYLGANIMYSHGEQNDRAVVEV